jgi:hypothetical protein
MNNANKPVAQFRDYTRFSGIAIQMGIIIAAGVIGGVKLDGKLNCSPLFTLIGSLGSIAISLYLVIKELSIVKNKKNAKDPD